MKQVLLGFDIGGTKCAVVLGRTTPEGVEILDRLAFPPKRRGGRSMPSGGWRRGRGS